VVGAATGIYGRRCINRGITAVQPYPMTNSAPSADPSRLPLIAPAVLAVAARLSRRQSCRRSIFKLGSRRAAQRNVVCRPSACILDRDIAGDRQVTAAYVHIPFCRQRCSYCDFPIDVLQKGKPVDERMLRYVDRVVAEISAGGAGAFDSTDTFEPTALSSIYFGGGTPSLLPTQGFARILDSLRQRFGVADDVEITVEMDPATFDQQKAMDLARLGVNRASIGIQSLDEEVLRLCGRGHSAQEAARAIQMVHAAGITNVSADLLSGVPGQCEDRLRADIQALTQLGVTHLSVYDLQFEDGTAFARRFPDAGQNGRPSLDLAAELYAATHDELDARGFEHYEISSFARRPPQAPEPGSAARRDFRSRHNQVYWSRRPYAAFGNGAASFVGGVRATRPRGMDDYCRWVDGGGRVEGLAEHDASPRDDLRSPLLEALMLGLRTGDGVEVTAGGAADADACVEAAGEALRVWEETGHAVVQLRRADASRGLPAQLRARLVPPQGFVVSDAVLSDALAAVLRVPEPTE